MTDIYQLIWTADQNANGVEPVVGADQEDAVRGFVRVNAELDSVRDADLRVLEDVHIPAAKLETYDLCRKLFNNYALPEAAREVDTPEERTERHEFVEAIRTSAPMEVARLYIEERTGEPVGAERWHNTLMDLWFRRFSAGGDPDLSGFEHVVVGEQEGSKVQGYHFWYKYYLDDGFARHVDGGIAVVPGAGDDRIRYVASKAGPGQMAFPESVTIQYHWDAPDYDAGAVRPLTKKIGGFFVGCSVEGLMALGTVRAHLGANAPKSAVIEGARYDMRVFRSPNNRHIRTFYPVFKGGADPVTGGGGPVPIPPGGLPPGGLPPVAPGAAGDVRIVAALVNPEGHDPGRETVTVINAGPVALDLQGWRIRDRNGNADTLSAMPLLPGEAKTILLSGDGAQLSNKGSSIGLVAPDGTVRHMVTYSKTQARRSNGTVIFA
jgi:poly(U)-specific endoribonuclease